VIVDSEFVANAALARVLSAQGFPINGEEALVRYSGLRWSDCHRAIEADSGRRFDPDELGALVDEAIAAEVERVPAIEGLEPFLAAQAHRKLAIASSSETAWLRSSLERIGLQAYFGDRLFSAANLARGKPHPDIYLRAAAALGVAPAQSLVIEDHPVGVAAGAAAGMTVVALLAGRHIREGHEARVRMAGARHVAQSYKQVAEIIAGLETP
jgi:HAD superfamily hydrolase (TIGR01509 family)